MKTRLGLVSNSSAASFTIYGWVQSDLENTPFQEEEYWDWCECQKLRKAILDQDPSLQFKIYSIRDQNDRLIVGFGKYATEIDHSFDRDCEWQDFVFPEPTISEGKHFDEIAKKLNLPQPKIYKDTWFDG